MISIEGAVTLQNTQSGNSMAGTIRWTGSDFEGWNGVFWVSLTGGKVVGTIMDYDGNIYNTVKIGEQVWMAENLKTTKLNDGNDILKPGQIGLIGSVGYRYYYNNDQAQFENDYGALYSWDVVNTEKICPIGWHVPDTSDWSILSKFVGGEAIAGGKLKSKGAILGNVGNGHWFYPNTSADNEFGFSARGGGYFESTVGFLNLHEKGFWWTDFTYDDPINGLTLMLKHMFHDEARIWNFFVGANSAASVRCIKD